MRVRVTVYYGDAARPLSRETRDFDLPLQEDDEESFLEARDHLTDTVLEPYQEEADLMDDEEEEDSIGIDYVAVWATEEPFETREEAKDFLDRIIQDAEEALAELE